MPINKNIPFALSGIALAMLSTQAQAKSVCEAGSYDEPPLDGICLLAPEGSYVPEAGATSAILASPGTFVNTTGATSATLAPLGSFVSTSGATAATLANRGTFVSTTGASAAVEAPVGSFVSSIGASSAQLASPGFFVATTGASAATAASVGTFVATSGASAATLAPVGSFVSEAGQTAALEAPIGTFVPIEGAAEAQLAPPGTYVNVTGASAPILAPPGTFVPSAGASAPTLTPPGTFAAESGSVAAADCPAGGWSPVGSTGCRDASLTLDSDDLLSPEFELQKDHGGTADLWTEILDPTTHSVQISNSTSDVGSPSALIDLTILDIVIGGANAGLFTLDPSLFSGGTFTPIVIGKGDVWSFDIVLDPTSYGIFSTPISFVTDVNAAFGSIGSTFTFDLTANVPEPSTTFLFLSGLSVLGFRTRKSRKRGKPDTA